MVAFISMQELGDNWKERKIAKKNKFINVHSKVRRQVPK